MAGPPQLFVGTSHRSWGGLRRPVKSDRGTHCLRDHDRPQGSGRPAQDVHEHPDEPRLVGIGRELDVRRLARAGSEVADRPSDG